MDRADDRQPDDLPRTWRSYQLRVLGDMNLPKRERSADDRRVRARDMKCVLEAFDNQAREKGEYDRPLGPTRPGDRDCLLFDSQLDSLRQLKRTLEVLERLGIVRKRTVKLRRGRRCCWQIDFDRLCVYAGLPKWSECIPSAQPARLSAQMGGTECPVGATKCPVERDQVPMRALTYTSRASAPLSAPNPPPPPPAAAELGEGEGVSWQQAEDALREQAGSKAPAIVARRAAERCLRPDQVLAAVEFYVAHRDAWDGPGAIDHALAQMTADSAASDWQHWPTPRAGYVLPEVRQERQQQREQAARRERDETDREQAEHDRRELELGADLDAIADEDLADALAAGCRDVGVLLEQVNRFGRDMLRRVLLETLERARDGAAKPHRGTSGRDEQGRFYIGRTAGRS